MFETGVVELMSVNHTCSAKRRNRDIFSIFFSMKVHCVFSLESPQRGDSIEYTQFTISLYEKGNHPKLYRICSYGICSKGSKNEFLPCLP